jgi:hypothetical protein
MDKKYILKMGDKGPIVELLQQELGVKVDGDFGLKTKAAVVNFQKNNGLVGDGIVGPITWDCLGVYPEEFYADTDIMTSASWIIPYMLPSGQYVDKITSKKYIFIHHTAGRSNPYTCIDHWAKDQRGRIGTHFVIGGIDSKLNAKLSNKDSAPHDGLILQAIPEKNYGFHLGPVKSNYMHTHSLSIELCSAGYLKKKGDKFYTWYNEEVHPSQVAELEHEFKGYKYYHKYSDKQIKALKALLILLSNKHDIDLQTGLIKMLKPIFNIEDASLKAKKQSLVFDYNEDMCQGKVTGLLSHSNVRKDKSDVFPQAELIQMLKSIAVQEIQDKREETTERPVEVDRGPNGVRYHRNQNNVVPRV